MYSDDEDDHYQNGRMDIIEINSVNRVRCKTQVLIIMFAIINTSKFPRD